jgi:predicted DNA-binding transcriptional regulator AlpA
MENRYRNAEAAVRIGTTKNTLYQWEKKKAAGDPRYADFPAPPRIAHSNHRFYTDADIERIRAWKDRTTVATSPTDRVAETVR